MTSAPFDFAPLLPPGLPAPAAKWTGLPKYNFTGGNNDADQVPVDGLIAAATAVLRREGPTLATYGLASGPQGYRPLREFLVAKLKRDAGIVCTADDILIISGSLQALDLVNGALLARGDTVHHRAGDLSGLAQPADAARRQGGRHPARPRRHAHGRAGRARSPTSSASGITAEIHLHDPDRAEPDRHHHAGGAPRRTAASSPAQYGVPIFEDDCYADLIWDGKRPPALYAMSHDRRRHPYRLVLEVDRAGAAGRLHRRALGRCCRACWRSRPMPAPARSSRWCWRNIARRISPTHVPALTRGLRAKLDTLMEALNEQFGTAAEFDDPKGGIFLWVKLPDNVDTLKLYQAALAGRRRDQSGTGMVDRQGLQPAAGCGCASPARRTSEIREGVAVLAEVCRTRIRRADAQRQRHPRAGVNRYGSTRDRSP